MDGNNSRLQHLCRCFFLHTALHSLLNGASLLFQPHAVRLVSSQDASFSGLPYSPTDEHLNPPFKLLHSYSRAIACVR